MKKIKAYTEENSIIPIYILKMDIENLGIVSIDCVSWNEDRALIHFNGNTYWIKDDEFIAYDILRKLVWDLHQFDYQRLWL